MIQKIDTISTIVMPNTVQKTSVYEYETEATSAKMIVLMNKTNERVSELNKLRTFNIWKDEE